MIASHTILAIGWILFCALHSIFASRKFKQFAIKKMRSQYKYFRLYYTLFAIITFAGILIYQVNIHSNKIFMPGNISFAAGSVVAFLGLVVMGICIVKYFMQVSGLKGLIETRTNNKLMITGVHTIVRHPLYAGTFVFIWGLLIIFPYFSLLIADTIITVYTLVGLQFEERKLEQEFGDAYKKYKREVPMIIPKFAR